MNRRTGPRIRNGLVVVVPLGLAFVFGCYRHTRPDSPAAASEREIAQMVAIPAGSFTMGDSNGDPAEYPERVIRISAFALDRFEVTNRDYQACVDAQACDSTPYADDPELGIDEHPVVGVSWYDAEKFCAWVGKRLPTEAEWEYAARGTDLRKWTWAGAFDASRANTRDGDPFDFTAPVGSFDDGRSPFGVHDLSGNAAEWVNDTFSPTYYRTSTHTIDPPGPTSGRVRVVRGGSYVDGAYAVRVSSRVGKSATETDNTLGFRCAGRSGTEN